MMLLTYVAWFSRRRSDTINMQIQHDAVAEGVGGDENVTEALISSKVVPTKTCLLRCRLRYSCVPGKEIPRLDEVGG